VTVDVRPAEEPEMALGHGRDLAGFMARGDDEYVALPPDFGANRFGLANRVTPVADGLFKKYC
jgi:hypothetical protein